MGVTPDDDRLRAAWDAFCDGLKEAGNLVFDERAPANELDRAAGLQYLTRYVTKAVLNKFEYDDPQYPQLWTLQHPTHKSFGDNPDCTYLVCPIDGGETYRISGQRGSVKWVSFRVQDGAINNADLQVDWNGNFEVWLSPEPHDGNWIATSPGIGQVFIREFFGHWDTEEPMTIQIERVGRDGPPPQLTAADVIRRLDNTITWLREDSRFWFDWIEFYRDRPNRFVTGMPGAIGGGDESALSRSLHFCQWNVEPDEALVIRAVPPRRVFWWNFELGNFWMNSSDYRYHLSSINSEQATVEDDGSVVIVVSHHDPEVPNWLNTAGHTSGLMPQRWVEGDDAPTPEAELVKFADLPEVLAGVRRITPEARREQLRRRKAGVDKRFPV